VENMSNNDKVIFLGKYGFEVRPEAGSRCYPYLIIDHNQNNDKLYFSNLDQAFEVIKRCYLPKEKNGRITDE
jgi:hypothetical protein